MTTLVFALKRTGTLDLIAPLVSTNTPITIFAPNDNALTSVAASLALNVTTGIRNVLLYHVVPQLFVPTIPGQYIINSLLTAPSLAKLAGSGQNVLVQVSQGDGSAAGAVTLNRVAKVTRSITADNAIIHVIGKAPYFSSSHNL